MTACLLSLVPLDECHDPCYTCKQKDLGVNQCVHEDWGEG